MSRISVRRLRAADRAVEFLEGTECKLITHEVDGVELVVGRKTCMPYEGPSRDRSRPGKARIRARRAVKAAV